jgi:hypothetical protein
VVGLNYKLQIASYRIKNKNKCKISHCSWLKLQITPYSIKNNLEVFGVGQNNNLVTALKFRQST